MAEKIVAKKTQKKYVKFIIIAVTLIIAYTMFSDWDEFKRGLFGL